MKRFLLIALCLVACAVGRCQNTTLLQEIERLQERYGVHFVYDSNLDVDIEFKCVKRNDRGVAKHLRNLLEGTNVDFKKRGKNIVLFEKNIEEPGVCSMGVQLRGVTVDGFTDSRRSLFKHLMLATNFNKKYPQEKVYLHFDNTGYFENEMMWFKAYVVRADRQKATDISRVLYVELLNKCGDVIKTTKWYIDSHGQASGNMRLDSILGSGFYEIRAYTRYMTNWGTNACFSRVFPIFKKPEIDGDYGNLLIKKTSYKQRTLNFRDFSDDSLYYNAVKNGYYNASQEETISVRFYPEGGNMIVGKKCHVAMLSVDGSGRAYSGDGFVTSSEGDVLAVVHTDSLGRGAFDVTPDGGEMHFQMKNLNNKIQLFTLPEAKAEGCALHVDAVSDDMLVSIGCTKSLCGKMIAVILSNNGNAVYCDTMTAVPKIDIELSRRQQKEGVNQFTIIDSNGKVLAERLFFICPKPSAADSIRIVSSTQKLMPCGKVELELNSLPNACISLSAIDAATMNNGVQGNMKTWMLLSSEVKGYIHNVDYYFEADDAEHRRNADLLMLTQGWRRYDWELMDGMKDFDYAQPIEDQFYIFGKLREFRKRNNRAGVDIEAYLYNSNGETLRGKTTTDADGNYAFKIPYVDGEWNVQIYSRIKGKRKTFYVGINRQFSPVPRYVTPLEMSALPPVRENLGFEQDSLDEEPFIPIDNRDQVLENVTVKAKRRYFTNDDYVYKDEGYGRLYAALYYNIDKEVDKLRDEGKFVPTFYEFIRQKLDADINEYDLGNAHKGGRDIEFVVNNNRRGNVDWYNCWMEDVKSAYIVFDGKVPNALIGDLNFFSRRDTPIIIYLYTHISQTTESQKGLRRTYFQGFNKPETFRMEDYSVIPPMADFRRTIYWAPNIRTDARGRARVEFYNNSICDRMYVSAEGMSDDGWVLMR
ncbi:MAG: hypothetical protein KBT33_06205 [Prevotellaceae bacterium]|nr:hypothetical protein [Candidatus Minthosoma equi]